MPKVTFEKLKEDKQNRIFEAAVDEFSQNTFTEASINQIIKKAKIPRGSFYQYFENKEDLYGYVIDRIRKEKIKLLYEMDKNQEAEEQASQFVKAFIQSLMYMFKWKALKPKYFQIGMLMEKDDSEFIKSHKGMTSVGIERFKSMIQKDQEKGVIRKNIDSELIVDVIVTSGMRLVNQCKEDKEIDEAKFLEKMNKLMVLIQYGFMEGGIDNG